MQPPKPLARFRGELLVRRVVAAALASRLSEVVVVLGRAADEVREALAGHDVVIAENPRFREGQSTSVRKGLAAIEGEVAAVMFLPVDQPQLSTEVIDHLVEQFLTTSAQIVVPTHAGRRGAPVVIARSLFGELQTLEGDVGGRQIFAAHEALLLEVPLATEAALRDVDTPDDLAAMES
jgi:molybdenum cofactor cytidylyltransferase